MHLSRYPAVSMVCMSRGMFEQSLLFTPVAHLSSIRGFCPSSSQSVSHSSSDIRCPVYVTPLRVWVRVSACSWARVEVAIVRVPPRRLVSSSWLRTKRLSAVTLRSDSTQM